MKITEEILYFAWQYGLFNREKLYTVKGEKVKIISLGIRNNDSGPDIFGARIKIGNYIWAGNVEIHLKASDWFKHNHHLNKAYNNVILHVVADYDITSKHKNYNLNTIILPINNSLLNKYSEFIKSKSFIPCASYAESVHTFVKSHMIYRTAMERLVEKSNKILETNRQNNGDWNETFYKTLARYFGTPQNTSTFEQLANNLPLKILAKHKNNIIQLEALLFGVANLIPEKPKDEYSHMLKSEWKFLQKKYKLNTLEHHQWKFMRMRPANFPTIRISQFAKLIEKSSSLFSKIISAYSNNDLKKLLQTKTSEYWEEHYTFHKKSSRREKKTGKNFIDILIINAIAPSIFAYGSHTDNSFLKDKALTLWELTDAENNKITQKFKKIHFPLKSALFSQGLLSLKHNYCNQNKCLYCIIGHKIFKTT